MSDFETHPRGTAEVLAQLRAEREALTVQVTEQRILLDRARQFIEHSTEHQLGNPAYELCNADITQHLRGKA